MPKTLKKTPNGLGTITQLPSGSWRWRVSVQNSSGNRTRLSGTEKTETLAKKALNKAVTDNERGLLAAPNTITLAEFSRVWLERQPSLSQRTRTNYRKEINYALEVLGHRKVRDIRGPHLKDMMHTLTNRVAGPRDEHGRPKNPDAHTMASRTLGKVLTRLRAIFREAVHDQIIYVNPCEGVRRPRLPTLENVGTVLDFPEKDRFTQIGSSLHAAGVCALWPAIFTALAIGLRRSEVMGLRWQDIDLEKNILKIRHTNVGQEKGFTLEEHTKTNSSRREINIPPSLRTMLEQHQAHQALARTKALEDDMWTDTDAVFTTAQGNWISPDNLNRAVKNVLEWADRDTLLRPYKPDGVPTRTDRALEGKTNLEKRMIAIRVDHRPALETIVRAGVALPDISPHDLRHTYATLALRSKVPVAVVSRTLGHARISITMDIYRHVLPSELLEHMFDMFAPSKPTVGHDLDTRMISTISPESEKAKTPH